MRTSTFTMRCTVIVVLFLSLCGFIYGLFWIRALRYVTQDAEEKATTSTVETVWQECSGGKREKGICEFLRCIHTELQRCRACDHSEAYIDLNSVIHTNHQHQYWCLCIATNQMGSGPMQSIQADARCERIFGLV